MEQVHPYSAYATYAQDPELDSWVDSIVNSNLRMNFVDRIARPNLYPSLPIQDGIATHMMAWGHIKGKPSVYPTIIFDPNTMKLQQLSDDDAYDHAIRSKEFIPFGSEEEADLFSKQYKRFWRNRNGGKF